MGGVLNLRPTQAVKIYKPTYYPLYTPNYTTCKNSAKYAWLYKDNLFIIRSFYLS